MKIFEHNIEEMALSCCNWNKRVWTQGLLNLLNEINEKQFINADILEIGAGRHSSLSPVFCLLGSNVTCTYYGEKSNPRKFISNIENQFNLHLKILINEFDIVKSDYHEAFDFIIVKSVLGGLSRDCDWERFDYVIGKMLKALKPKGKLLILENSYGTKIHNLLRNISGAGTNGWHYIKPYEFRKRYSVKCLKYIDTLGFISFADFKNDKLNHYLTIVDNAISSIIPQKNKILLAAILAKE